MESTQERFVHLADVGDLVSARVCAALLQSEGVDVRLHGESLGPYPVTVGRLAVTQIWVPQESVELAAEIMLEAEVEHALNPEVRGGAIADRESLPMRAVALLIAVVLMAAILRAVLRVF